jgi:hypothetical protein
MAEVYTYSNDLVSTKIFWQNDIVSADAAVLVDIYDVSRNLDIYSASDPAYTETLLLANRTASPSEVDGGTYLVEIPRSITQVGRDLRLHWKYSINGQSTAHDSFCNVVTPYCSLAEAMEDLGFGSDSSDPNYKTYHQLRMAEKYARKIIENFTGQQFYLYEDVYVGYGAGTDIMPLPFKLNDLFELYQDDVQLIDNEASPAVNNWNYIPLISETGFGLRVNKANYLDNVVYTANGLVPPTINDIGSGGAFRQNSRYRIRGMFGWEDVPGNVEEACVILMGEYFSKDSTWKNKYVQNVQSFDWQFEYFDDVFRGTGNLYVDQLLQPYVITNMLVV